MEVLVLLVLKHVLDEGKINLLVMSPSGGWGMTYWEVRAGLVWLDQGFVDIEYFEVLIQRLFEELVRPLRIYQELIKQDHAFDIPKDQE